jgi:hypothetical protein
MAKLILELSTATGTPLVLWVIGFVALCVTLSFKMKSVETPDITQSKD